MFTYGSLRRYIPFRIRNRRNRTCFLHISRYLGWDPIHLTSFGFYWIEKSVWLSILTWLINRNTLTLDPCHIFHTSHWIDIIFMEYYSLSRCLGGEMVDTRDSKSRAQERGGSSPLQGIILRMLIEWAIPRSRININSIRDLGIGISSAADHEILVIFSI